ncbi:FAD:protein FMN transferase [Azospira restricta]|uniref:FAD:protein FMN transferase n=1 Tax=Azospira restricta TaxID=404405 RepID=A0A974SQ92_9RHOO|nr:FAD:protein FMN transferase [Azospira restricta]QRJ64462.1 FAD:protein FMN transferase [Azospira restricta]
MRVLILLLAAALLAACGKPPVHGREAFVFGTRVEVLVADADATRAAAAMSAVLQEFDRLHRTYHAWQPSELTALNAALAEGRPHAVTSELAAFIVDAQAIAAAGDHLFDPGIGRLIALWGFQSDEFRPRLPDAAALDAWRRAAPSIADLRVDGRMVTSAKREVALDFGGYLKGVALDRAAALLRAQGVGNALVNIGGNVIALGTKYGQPWRVGIQHPRAPGTLATLTLADGEAIGTSGDYQRFFELDGRRYCHLLDPRSAAPVTHTQALTVLVAPQPGAGMRSDAASKPLFVAGDGWRRLLAPLGVAGALRVAADGRVQVSRTLAARLKFEPGLPAPEIVD